MSNTINTNQVPEQKTTVVVNTYLIGHLLPDSPIKSLISFSSTYSFNLFLLSPIHSDYLFFLTIFWFWVFSVILVIKLALSLSPTIPHCFYFFYYPFMWLKPRLRVSERDRQSAEEANRLFKQEFGDKIESLQLEVDQLRKQWWRNDCLL